MGVVIKLLSTNGDGTGTTDAIGNYSVTPLSLKYIAPEKYIVSLTRIIVKVRDAGDFDTEKYGNNITLTNGIRIYQRHGNGDLIAELTALPITSTGDWSAHCYDVQELAFGTGDHVLSVRWTFAASGQAVKLDGQDGDYLELVLNDNFTGLNEHIFCIQGFNNG